MSHFFLSLDGYCYRQHLKHLLRWHSRSTQKIAWNSFPMHPCTPWGERAGTQINEQALSASFSWLTWFSCCRFFYLKEAVQSRIPGAEKSKSHLPSQYDKGRQVPKHLPRTSWSFLNSVGLENWSGAKLSSFFKYQILKLFSNIARSGWGGFP